MSERLPLQGHSIPRSVVKQAYFASQCSAKTCRTRAPHCVSSEQAGHSVGSLAVQDPPAPMTCSAKCRETEDVSFCWTLFPSLSVTVCSIWSGLLHSGHGQSASGATMRSLFRVAVSIRGHLDRSGSGSTPTSTGVPRGDFLRFVRATRSVYPSSSSTAFRPLLERPTEVDGPGTRSSSLESLSSVLSPAWR